MRTSHLIVITLVSILGVAACGPGGAMSDGSGPQNNPSQQFTGARGVVVDTLGQPIEGVFVNLVQGDGAYVDTGPDGSFEIATPALAEMTLAVSKPGFLPVRRVISIVDGGATWVDVTMIPETEPVPIDAQTGGTAMGPRGAAVIAPPGVFVLNDGETPYVGVVDVFITPIDPSNPAELAGSPAALDQARDGAERVMLQSYGMVSVELKKQGGFDTIRIAKGKTVTLHLPVGEGIADRPDTIPLWNAEWTTWVREGEATYDPELDLYTAEVGHFSSWNLDIPLGSAQLSCVRGVANNEAGEAVAGAYVVATGKSYAGTTNAVSDAEGVFCVTVLQNAIVDITVFGYDGKGTTREIQTGALPASVPPVCDEFSCEEKGEWTLTGGATGPTDTDDAPNAACKVLDTLDPCLNGLKAMFECWNPQGQCTLNSTGITWANGSALSGQSFIGPNGQTCGTADMVDQTYIEYTTNGQTWSTVEDAETGNLLITCPSGKEVSMTVAQGQAFEACNGKEASSSNACLTNDSLGGGTCDSDSDCQSGQTCCSLTDNLQVCILDAACPG